MKRILGFSGGIDSQACALWMRNTFPPEDLIFMNSNAGGNEHPMTEEFIAAYSANVFPVVCVKALICDLGTRGTKEGATRDRRQEFAEDDDLTFDRLAYVKGRFPSRKMQFCTEHLKLAPQRRWILENLEPGSFVQYTGVRRDESERRKCAAEKEYDDYFACMMYRPIVTWSKQQCFDYVLQAGEEINPLYRLGFNRVGCAPCVNSNKDDIRTWACRFPEMIDKVREWERRVGRTFFAPHVPGLAINWIDEVVAWARTERGGKQLSLPLLEVEAESGVCVSKYGICE